MTDTFSIESIEKAVMYLAESAAKYGKARGLVTFLESKVKVVEAEAFNRSEGTMDERKAKARLSDDYQKAIDQYRDAVTEAETIRAYRGAAEAKIEVWRSLESSRRASNV